MAEYKHAAMSIGHGNRVGISFDRTYEKNGGTYETHESKCSKT